MMVSMEIFFRLRSLLRIGEAIFFPVSTHLIFDYINDVSFFIYRKDKYAKRSTSLYLSIAAIRRPTAGLFAL